MSEQSSKELLDFLETPLVAGWVWVTRIQVLYQKLTFVSVHVVTSGVVWPPLGSCIRVTPENKVYQK